MLSAILKQHRTKLHKQTVIEFKLLQLNVFVSSFLFLLTVTCPMNEVLTASTGVVMSQSPGTGFPHFESCSWVVKVEPGYNITFTIEHFQTSRQFDELEIFDGESLYLFLKGGDMVTEHVLLSFAFACDYRHSQQLCQAEKMEGIYTSVAD